jgi:MFS transporter, UMF1 family
MSTRRERWAWYLYDFGNSAYAAVVLLAVYAAYFKGTVVGGTEAEGTAKWGLALTIVGIIVLLTAPVLGTIADFSGSKKRFLFFFTALSCIFTAGLFFATSGRILIGMLFFILAEIGYRGAQVFYDALLPEIAPPEQIGRISGNGWAIGSLGGIICLLLVLIPIIITNSSDLVVRLSLVFTAVYYFGFSIPLFLWLRERAKRQPLPHGENYLGIAFKRLARTMKSVRRFRDFLKFMLAFLIYNDGILMVMDFAAILGAVLFGMKQQEMIIFMIIVQVTSIGGAYLFGLLADDFGAKRSLVLSLLLVIAPIMWLYFTDSKLAFYIIGGLVGFALTGVQSVSRTAVAMFAPPGQSGEFYGFFAFTGRTSSFIGPAVFSQVAALATVWYARSRGMEALAAEQAGHRLALFSIVAFLVVGLLLLLWVNEKQGRAAATQAAEQQGRAPTIQAAEQ